MTCRVSAFYNCLWLLGSWVTIWLASVRVTWKLEESVNFESELRNCSSTRKGSLGTHMHVECENKGLTLLANVSAPSELGIVSGEFLFHARCYPSCTASWDSWNWFFQTHFLSPSLIMCYSFVMLAQKSEGPAGGTWPVGWAAFGSWFCFWVLLSAWRWCKSVWLVVKVMCSNLSCRLGCDSPLFL